MAETTLMEILIANVFLLIVLAQCQDRILVAEESLENYSENTTYNESIPERLLLSMKDVQSVSDFLRLFVTPANEPLINTSFNSRSGFETDKSITASYAYVGTTFHRRPYAEESFKTIYAQKPNITRGPKLLFGDRTDNKEPRQLVPSPGFIAQPANCQTEQHIVELDKPENGVTMYWPSCVRLRRCGGCCTSSLLECQPTQTSILNVTVLHMKYNHNSGTLETRGMKTFTLQQHDRCSCSCKERREHCNLDVHEYREDECRCVCRNREALASCTGPKKIWDSKNCMCKCRIIRMCSTGRYFNVVNCRCQVLRPSLAIGNFTHLNTSTTLQTPSNGSLTSLETSNKEKIINQ